MGQLFTVMLSSSAQLISSWYASLLFLTDLYALGYFNFKSVNIQMQEQYWNYIYHIVRCNFQSQYCIKI